VNKSYSIIPFTQNIIQTPKRC